MRRRLHRSIIAIVRIICISRRHHRHHPFSLSHIDIVSSSHPSPISTPVPIAYVIEITAMGVMSTMPMRRVPRKELLVRTTMINPWVDAKRLSLNYLKH